MVACNRCQQEIKWPEPYQQGQKPLNMDGSVHSCAVQNPPPADPQQQTINSTTVLTECGLFLDKFQGIPDAKFDALARIFISRMMKR